MDADLQVPSFASYSGSMYPRSNTFISSPSARGGTTPVAELNNSPTFQAFINKTIERIILLGRGPPGAVGDGKTIGASMRWSQAALAALPVELWPRVDIVENWHCAEVACLAPTAANLKLRHEPFPAPVQAMVLRMIAEGHIDKQFARGCDVGLGSGGSDSSRRLDEVIEDEASGELGTLHSLLQKAATALERAKDNAGGAEGGGAANDSQDDSSVAETAALVASIERSIKAHKEAAGLRTPLAATSAAGAEYTVTARFAPPPKQAAPTPKSLADQAQIQQLQRESAGAIHRLHAALPKTLIHWGPTPAPAELLSAVVLNDVLMRMESQRAVLESVGASLTEAATTNCSAARASISGKAIDTTFDRLIREKVVVLCLSPVDRLFGLVPGGDLAMAVARSNHVPQMTKAALQLAALASRVSFVAESGELDVSSVAAALLKGMAEAGDADADNDYDALVRSLGRAIAHSRHLGFKVVTAGGVVHDWGEFANKTIDMIADQGHLAFTSADYRELTGVIFLFGRLRARGEGGSRQHSPDEPAAGRSGVLHAPARRHPVRQRGV